MKLESITMHGEHWKNGFRYPGFAMAKLADGRQIFFPESEAFQNAVISGCRQRGIDCADFLAKQAEANKARSYPEKPKADLWQRDYGYQPAEVIKWDFSTTFGRWGALVRFADGFECYTFPKTF